jgi:hypothetical protein
MVSPTENFIGNFRSGCNISNNYLFALSNHNSAKGASVMSRAGTTPTERLDLKSIYAVG